MNRDRTLFAFLLTWLLVCWFVSSSSPSKAPRRPVEPSEPQKAIWVDLTPLKPVDANLGPLLGEIDAHVPNPAYWRSFDRGNWAHEGTHGVNARIRNTFNRPGFYLGGDRALLASHPPTTIHQIATLVPPPFRGFLYQTYCIAQAASWNSEPLYLWDEWSAYLNGAIVDPKRRETLTQFFPIALTIPLAAPLDAATEAAYVELFTRSLPHLVPDHPFLIELRTGPSAQPIRDWLEARGLLDHLNEG